MRSKLCEGIARCWEESPCAVEPFCRTEEDTTYLAVRRLLAEYYSMKADEAWVYLQKEEDRLEGKGVYIQ
jgi:hypothetical protein